MPGALQHEVCVCARASLSIHFCTLMHAGSVLRRANTLPDLHEPRGERYFA